LTSLSRQTTPAEVIVVNDASTDHTPAVLAAAASQVDLRVINHPAPRGRAGATNAGARVATGDILVFFDGDTLAHPELVARHAAVHADGTRSIGRGGRFTCAARFPQIRKPGRRALKEVGLPASRRQRAALRVTRVESSAISRRSTDAGTWPIQPGRRCDGDGGAHTPVARYFGRRHGCNLSVRRDDFCASVVSMRAWI
jgi:glycosyltransferase involved in cell wall biosynthesis